MKAIFAVSLFMISLCLYAQTQDTARQPRSFNVSVGKEGRVEWNDSTLDVYGTGVNIDFTQRSAGSPAYNQFTTSTLVTLRGMLVDSNITTESVKNYITLNAPDGNSRAQLMTRYEGSLVIQLIPDDPIRERNAAGQHAPVITTVVKCLIPGYRIRAFTGLADTYPFPANLPEYTTTGTLVTALQVPNSTPTPYPIVFENGVWVKTELGCNTKVVNEDGSTTYTVIPAQSTGVVLKREDDVTTWGTFARYLVDWHIDPALSSWASPYDLKEIPAPTVTPTPTPLPVFVVGDYVIALDAKRLHSAPDTSTTYTQINSGMIGKIIDADRPQPYQNQGWDWYYTTWDVNNTTVGWTANNNLQKYVKEINRTYDMYR